MPISFLPSFLAGLIAAALFIAVLALGLGFFFLFLPSLPLFWLGLSGSPKHALIASFVGAVTISVTTDSSIGFFFLLLLGLPAAYISMLALRGWQDKATRVWFPIGLVFTHLTFYAAGFIALLAAYYAMQDSSLESHLATQIRNAFVSLGGQYEASVETLATQLSFLVFSLSLWLWGLALYFHAWLTHRLLAAKQRTLRPDFAIHPFLPPSSLLFFLALCAFASLVAGPALAFLGKTLLIALLFPYFLLGDYLMRQAIKTWPSHRFFLVFFYFMTVVVFWPALALAGLGIWRHIKHLSAQPDSTRS